MLNITNTRGNTMDLNGNMQAARMSAINHENNVSEMIS